MREFKTRDTGMGLPEFVRSARIFRDNELPKDESVEIWNDAVEKSARSRGIYILISIIRVEPKFEGV